MSSYIERIRGAKEATVVPINATATRRDATDGLHPYAAAIRTAWLDRLDALATRPWREGDAWDTNCFVTARKLIELANSPWAGYRLTDARGDYFDHAPRDSVWDQREKCWLQAEKVAAGVMLPEPEPGESYTVPDVTILPAAAERPAGGEGSAETDERDVEEIIRDRFPLLDFHDLLSTDDDGEEWILEPLLPARRLVALYSAPKAGKSLLMLEIAVGVALGREVIGTIPEPRRVLYVDFENDPRGDVKRRLEAMGLGPDDGRELTGQLCYLSFPTMAKLDTPQGGFELLSAAQTYGCDVVVIDTVSRAVGGEENDNDTWLAFYRNTGMILKGAGIACLRLDHSGKDAEKGMRGGSAKYGDVDAVWRLTAESPTVLELVCTDHRMPLEHDRLTVIRDVEPVLRHRAIGDRTLALSAREAEIDRALDALGLDSNCSVRAAKNALREAGHKFANPAIEKTVKARKMRLPERPGDTPGTPGDTPARVRSEASPETPLRSRGFGDALPTPSPSPSGTVSDEVDDQVAADRMFVVGCKRCYRPTHRDVTATTGGLCPECARAAGVVEEVQP